MHKTVHLTLVPVVGDLTEVDEVRSDDGVTDCVALSKLDLDPLAQWREHLGEDDLLVPNGSVRVLFHGRSALQKFKREKFASCSWSFSQGAIKNQFGRSYRISFGRINLRRGRHECLTHQMAGQHEACLISATFCTSSDTYGNMMQSCFFEKLRALIFFRGNTPWTFWPNQQHKFLLRKSLGFNSHQNQSLSEIP